VAAYEDLWLNHRLAGRELLREDLAALYDAFETPRKVRGDLEFLRGEELREYMAAVRERALEAPVRDEILHELVIRHELQHTETMLQAMTLAGIAPPSFTGPRVVPGSGLELVEVPEGPFELGAGPDGFAYDNERPRHGAWTSRFTIGRTPVTNATWLRFAEGGGYERREWWSDEGWAWKEQYDITHHAAAEAGSPDAPIVHVSWFEADAFARAHEARLPTEAEWEKAATSDQLEGVGEVWEWTQSHFTGYPGFVAHPYREYSEVFFGDRYRVLRGGSCATHPRVASPRFRNWDLPERRQLFAGVRIAR
jgi:iron(II)-dependent oxidoreductase